MEACRFLLCISAQFHQCGLRKSVSKNFTAFFSSLSYFLQWSVNKVANLDSVPARGRGICLYHSVYNDFGVYPAFFFGLGTGEVFPRNKAVGL